MDIAQLRISKVCARIPTPRSLLCYRGTSRAITGHRRRSGALATTNGTSRIFHEAHLRRDDWVIVENCVSIYIHCFYKPVHLVQHVVYDHTTRERFAVIPECFEHTLVNDTDN